MGRPNCCKGEFRHAGQTLESSKWNPNRCPLPGQRLEVQPDTGVGLET